MPLISKKLVFVLRIFSACSHVMIYLHHPSLGDGKEQVSGVSGYQHLSEM